MINVDSSIPRTIGDETFVQHAHVELVNKLGMISIDCKRTNDIFRDTIPIVYVMLP